jgi:peptide deformylase
MFTIRPFKFKEGPTHMKIYTYPAPVLRAVAEPVKDINGELQALIDNMIHTMYDAPSGIGLAANQIGETSQIIVYDLTHGEGGGNAQVLINPEITEGEGDATREEACLSLIHFSAEIIRKAIVEVRAIDRHGNPVVIEADDLLAVCLQHEIDHLNGVLIMDHVSSLKRSLYKKRLQKKLKKG